MTATKLEGEKLMGGNTDKYKDLSLQTEGNICTMSRPIKVMLVQHPYHLRALAIMSRRPGEEAPRVFAVQGNAALAMEGHRLFPGGQPK